MSAVAPLDESTFVRLEKLSRKAANDSLRARGAHLADDQFDSLAVHLLALGVRAYERYDVALAGGVARETYAFRAMRGYRQGKFTEGPYFDWLRTHVRDSRFEPAGSVSVTELGTMPETEAHDEMRVELVLEQYAAGLSERDSWTLRHVATAIASGYTMAEVVERLLGDLADALQPQIDTLELTPSLSSFEELFDDWIQEAAA